MRTRILQTSSSGDVAEQGRGWNGRRFALAAALSARRWVMLGWFAAALAGLAAHAGGLLREVYTGIGGSLLDDLYASSKYPDQPDLTEILREFEAPTDVLDNYGQRLRGFVVPPVSGNYTFWIASDDGGQLWLSTDDNPANRRQIASVNAWPFPVDPWGFGKATT